MANKLITNINIPFDHLSCKLKYGNHFNDLDLVIKSIAQVLPKSIANSSCLCGN